MAIGDIQIPEDIDDEYYFLMNDFKAMMIDGKGKSPSAMNAYYNNFVNSHRNIQDLAAFAMALNHMGSMLSGEDQRLYYDMQVNVTREVYESSEFSEEDKMLFRRYLD